MTRPARDLSGRYLACVPYHDSRNLIQWWSMITENGSCEAVCCGKWRGWRGGVEVG
jgi:hypothetical protein